jgi:hypothetical protein
MEESLEGGGAGEQQQQQQGGGSSLSAPLLEGSDGRSGGTEAPPLLLLFTTDRYRRPLLVGMSLMLFQQVWCIFPVLRCVLRYAAYFRISANHTFASLPSCSRLSISSTSRIKCEHVLHD